MDRPLWEAYKQPFSLGPRMTRPRQRVCLQDGLKLDLNQLVRKGFIKHGANIGVRGITWTHSYWGEIATGFITADMSGTDDGWFRIQLGCLDQQIILVPRARHFGGRQWYFKCPVMRPSRICACGSRAGRRGFAAVRPGADKSPTDPNSTTQRAGPMPGKARIKSCD